MLNLRPQLYTQERLPPCQSCDPSGRELLVRRTEELVVDPIGRNARLPQARNEVAEKRTRAAQVDVGLGQRDVGPQPIHADPPGMGRDVCAVLVKSTDDDISVARRGVLHLPGQCVMCRTACSENGGAKIGHGSGGMILLRAA